MLLLRTLAALVIACAMGIGSCVAASAVITPRNDDSTGVEAAVRLLSPFVIGALITAWTYYLLLVGEREDLLSRRARRAARSYQLPNPLAMSALTLMLVVGASVVLAVPILKLGGIPAIFAVTLLGSSLLLALLLALFVGIVTARVRARAKQTALDKEASTRLRAIDALKSERR